MYKGREVWAAYGGHASSICSAMLARAISWKSRDRCHVVMAVSSHSGAKRYASLRLERGAPARQPKGL